ncbi:hypothetical protein LCM10_03305 [Rossellomorea aquimaris]|uniref:hypothetical protein n=1 Tax=Rossellomorea aquimaris TaxID=189382 RepID=UPI001CD5740E|nr:hypothetical protein [Rossellomorea aquimaris]MCA1054003.1 hypothetical protein [Rossellomorea aquimaris]
MLKKQGLFPSIIFGSFILMILMIFSLLLFGGEKLQQLIQDGFTDDEPVSIQSEPGKNNERRLQ